VKTDIINSSFSPSRRGIRYLCGIFVYDRTKSSCYTVLIERVDNRRYGKIPGVN